MQLPKFTGSTRNLLAGIFDGRRQKGKKLGKNFQHLAEVVVANIEKLPIDKYE